MGKDNTKLKLFLENMLVYGLGGTISKIVPVIMVPIVTRLLPDTSYYGLSDLCTTVISFGSAVAVLGMYDAMYRLYFENDGEDYKKTVCSTALFFTLIMSVIVFAIMTLFRKVLSEFVFGGNQYTYLIWIAAFATVIGSSNNIIAAPTRMQNKRKQYIFVHTLTSVLSYAISIPLILSGHYIIALPIGMLLSKITIETIYWCLNKEWFKIKSIDFSMLKPLLKIAVPLFPTFLIYWIFNSSDKLMIRYYLDAAQVGIYSTGSKLGHCSQLIYTAFSGGWQFFAFSTMKEKNQVQSNSRIFEYLGAISFGVSLFAFALSKPIFQILFTGDYILGYVVAPFLFLAPLLQMLFQVAGNQFIVIKKSWPITLTLLGGAILNVCFNIVFIPVLGIEGASIATLLGYAIAIFVCVVVLCRIRLMQISYRFVIVLLLSIAYILAWRIVFCKSIIISFFIALIISFVFAFLYRTEFSRILKQIVRRY